MSDSNFVIKNGLAYTEDSILVYNLFIYKISSKVTEEDFNQYLKKFGEIVRFRLYVRTGFGRRRKGSRHAFVNYKNAKNAASVLQKQMHIISPGKAFSVKACDSWHQPNSSKSLIGKNIATNSNNSAKITKTNNCESSAPVGVNIVDLNEDCLLILLKTMPLRDQVSFARSHVKFEALFKDYARFHCKIVNSDQLDQMSLWNIRQFFILVGEFIENITLVEWFQNKDRERIASFVQLHCPNLKRIKLDTAKIRVPSLHKILSRKPKLKMLSLNCLSINDHCIHAMKKTPSLEHLTISHCYNFSGRFLYLLPQLKTLRLYECCNLKTSCLQNAINSMPNLMALDVRGAERLQQGIFDCMALKNKNLEILQMSCINANYDSIARIPKLRSLALNCGSFSTNLLRVSVFRALVENCGEQLESLQIKSSQCLNKQICDYIAQLKYLKKLHIPQNAGINDQSLQAFCALKNLVELKLDCSKNFTNAGLLELIQSCPKLKWVNIEKTLIDNDFAKKLLPILKREKRENGPLTFMVSGNNMNEFFDLPEEFKGDEMKSMVEFVFKHKSGLKNYDNLYDDFENDYNGTDEVPFFQTENSVFDYDESDYGDDDGDDEDHLDFDDDDDDLEHMDFLLNIPIFQHLALRHAFDYEFEFHNDSDDDDDDDEEDVYLW